MAKAKAKKELIEEDIDNGTTEESNTAAVQTDIKEEVAATDKEKEATAKAGKRSAKALKEAEAKQAKEERKAKVVDDTEAKPKSTQKPARSRLERRGKKFRELAKQIEAHKEYALKEALELAVATNPAKFDATVELHINLGVDPKQADQNVRDNLVLPAGTGKTIKIAVFAEADDAEKAKQAGADIVGIETITGQLDKNVIAFDTLIATPASMARLGKYARILGPKGLMPNPKSGTVTPDVVKAVKEAKAGRVEYRVDSTGIVHLGIGKVSFGAANLQQNAAAILASVKAAKPASIKGIYVKSIHVTTSMGPSVKISASELN